MASPDPALQTPRFRVLRPLGQGGQGRVFAVLDHARHAVVAMKEAPLGHAAALAREFERLIALRHPHLAEVYELFPESPLSPRASAFTQRLVEGRDLFATLRDGAAASSDAPDAPRLDELLAEQLLSALAVLHAVGLAHLDLKPDNILVEPGPPWRARLLDFGVAARLGESTRFGTRSYLAPELLEGAAVAPQADLFALGVTLAEARLGTAALARELGLDAPQRRTERLVAAGMGPSLATLVARLVDPDPAQRPPSAQAAARLLGRARGASVELLPSGVAAGLVRSGGLVGRDGERLRIAALIAARRSARVSGPPGSGRGALAEAAVRDAQARGHRAEVWPLAAESADVDGFLAALGRLVPRAGSIGLAPGLTLDLAGDSSATRQAAPQEAGARFDAALDALVAAALEGLRALPCPDPSRPPVLGVPSPDEAPWPVRAFLTRALETPGLPLALVVPAEAVEPTAVPAEAVEPTAVPAEAVEPTAVPAEAVEPSIAARPAGTVVVQPADAGLVARLVASRFGPELATVDLVAALTSASGGHFAHLEAVAELLVASRALVLDESGWSLRCDPRTLDLPDDLERARSSRLALLSHGERRVLDAVAALTILPEVARGLDGPASPTPARRQAGLSPRLEAVPARLVVTLLANAAEPSAASPASAAAIELTLSALAAAGLVHLGAEGRVALGHPALARALVGPGRAGLPAAAFASLLSDPDLDGLPRALALAAAGRPLDAAEAALALARSRRAELRLVEAEWLCLFALSHPHPAPQEALSLRAELADHLGPREVQRAALTALLAHLPSDDPRRLDVGARLFWTLTRMADPALEPEGQRLIAEARAASRPELAAEVAVHLAIVASQRGDQDRAERLLTAARADLGASSPRALLARIANNLGNVHAYRGAAEAALACYEEALALKVADGDPVGQRIALGNVALMQLELGRPRDAVANLARSHALALSTGHRRGQAWTLLTLAEVGLDGAAHRYAARRATAAATLAAELGDRLVEGDARTTLAEALWGLGDSHFAAAHREAAAGLALATSADNAWTASRARLLVALTDPRGPQALEDDPQGESVTRRLAARLAAEDALRAGDVARAVALIAPHAKPPEARGKGGVRSLAFERTALRVAELSRPRAASERAAAELRAKAQAFVASWPAEPLSDGVDTEAETEGPCRRTVLADPSVSALLGPPEAALALPSPVPSESSLTSPPDPSRVIAPAGFDPGAFAGADRAGLERALAAALVELVREVDAERAMVLVVPRGTEAPEVLIARDADGEPVSEPGRRLPEAALDAALRATPWRAAEGRGAVLVLPWSLPLGSTPVRAALALQNRFVADAFSEPAAIDQRAAVLRLALRLLLLERELVRERDAVARARDEARAIEARSTEEIRTLRRELETTREQIGPARDYPEIIFSSGAMKRMLRQVDRVIGTELPVHIHGESGTGKELIARAIHHLGSRTKGPFVPQNCTAIPPTLFESELFGHERGAFTGAMRATEGLFRRAHGGTLFLDEIGDLPLELQAKLLRVLETGEVRPVGATRNVSVDVRIVSATHRDLADLIRLGRFREDLYYRLNVIRIDIPPLRDRPEDIPVLVDHFLSQRPRPDGRALSMDDRAMRALVRYDWPGNVRQLENELARAGILAEGGVIGLGDLSPEITQGPRRAPTPAPTRSPAGAAAEDAPRAELLTLSALGLDQGQLKDRIDRLETLALKAALAEAHGNKSEVARVLGLSRAGLNLKLRRLGLWDGE